MTDNEVDKDLIHKMDVVQNALKLYQKIRNLACAKYQKVLEKLNYQRKVVNFVVVMDVIPEIIRNINTRVNNIQIILK
jgi:hypothetical protein